MSEIRVFENANFGKVRVLIANNQLWFVGKDICQALGYKKHTNVLSQIAENKKKKEGIPDCLGRFQNTIVIDGAGLWDLFNLALSQKDILPYKKSFLDGFKCWIATEIIPKIRSERKRYESELIEEIINNPDFGIRLLTELKKQREANRAR